jgi:hypothetical protein
MAKDTDLVWLKLDVASLPAAVRKNIEDAQKYKRLGRENAEAARKALEKHWIDTKVVDATHTVLLGFNKFDETATVATKERPAPKASAKPVIGWGGFKK